MRRLLPLALLLIADAPGSSIEVEVSGVRSAEGRIWVSVCPKQLFLANCPLTQSAPARVGTVSVIVPGVAPGRYAVQVYHDANNNGKLDRNWIGLPREGVGFSNDAMPRLTYPRFSVAGFDHGAIAQHIPVKMHYFLG